MDRFEVTSRVPHAQRGAVLDLVHDILVREHALSPRTWKELTEAYDAGNVCLALSHDEVVGWVLCLPRGRRAQELAGAYVAPELRGSRITSALLREALGRRLFTVCVTSDPKLTKYLRWWGFQTCSPRRLVKITGLSMLWDRISPSRLRFGRSYVRVAAFQLLVFDRAVSGRWLPAAKPPSSRPRQKGRQG